jgi:pimeloyl-ACP methyl ester carboxylesterase
MNTNTSEPQVSTRYLSLAEGRVAYDVVGSGPLVVLIPGMGDLRSSFRHLVPLIAAAGYTVVSTDLRGHGDSDASFSSYGDSDTADDVIALLDELGGPAVLVGNSLGAAAAVLASARRPELVRGIALVDAFVRNPANANAFTLAMFRVLMARPWVAAVWKAYLPSLYKGNKPVDFPEYLADVVAGLRRPGYAKAFSQTTHTSHAEAEQNLPRVKKPTLVVMGELDPDFPNPLAEATWIGEQLGGDVVMIADSGHYPQSQQPQATADAIIPFLATISPNA